MPLDDPFPAMRELRGEAFVGSVNRHIRIELEVARMVPDILVLARRRPPELVVRQRSKYGGCVAAEVLGIPHASVRTAVTASSFGSRCLVAPELDTLRAAYGLPPDPGAAMAFRYLHLAAEPAGLWPPDDPPAPTSHLVRPEPFDNAEDEELPGWMADFDGAPLICATLGTFMNRSAAIFQAILDGLRKNGVQLILTIGRDQDPARFGRQPEHVRIERYIPLTLLLPHCALLICHAGFRTVTTALAHGVPLVMTPLGAGQPRVAEQVARLGVGAVVGPREHALALIRAAARQVLDAPAYRKRAEQNRDTMRALPGPPYAVELLERLAIERRPIEAGHC